MSDYYVKSSKNDCKCADLYLSGSKWRTNNIRTSEWYTGEILEYGIPRSDIFYQNGEIIKKRVYDYYGIDKNIRLVLYVPTFRNDYSSKAYFPLSEYDSLLHVLEKKFGGEWKAIIRVHPNTIGHENSIDYSDKILNGTEYPDVNELIVASDVLITDYSGCMFEALEANKIVFLYMADLEEYMDERGFHFPLNELPFPVSVNSRELGTCIENFAPEEYERETKKFWEPIGCFNDGHASERVADYIVEQIKRLPC